MKKFLIIATLLSFVIAAPFAMAQEKPMKGEPKVKCCVKGNCKEITDAKCVKDKGEVVTDCKDCKVDCCVKGESKRMTIAECKKEKGKVNPKECKPLKTPKQK